MSAQRTWSKPSRCIAAQVTAIGAAALAGLAVGVFASKDEVARATGTAKRYEPQLDKDEAERLVREWRRAVKNALG